MQLNKICAKLKRIFTRPLRITRLFSHQLAVNTLTDLYNDIPNWPVARSETIYVEDKIDNILYGEITYESMEILAKKLSPSARDVFYDLGCGIGRFVCYMYLTTSIKKSVGIEMVGSRYKLAELVAKLAEIEKFLDPRRKLEFIHNNIRNEHFSDATIIYMSSLCFPSELMEELNQKFLKLKKGLRIISLVPLPEHPSLKLKEVSTLPMTWNENSTIYYYKLI